MTTFDDVHKLANDLAPDGDRIPFVSYSPHGALVVLSYTPSPVPPGHEDQLRMLLARGVGFRCGLMSDGSGLHIDAFLIGIDDKPIRSCDLPCDMADGGDDEINAVVGQWLDEVCNAVGSAQ